MEVKVENVGGESGNGQENKNSRYSRPTFIVFLYKCRNDVSLRSFDMNVARIAELPLSVVDRANSISHKLDSTDKENIFTSSFSNKIVNKNNNNENNNNNNNFAGESRLAVSVYSRIKNLA